jgi:catechol 2,3-dioxygenase-like lactoylglutathione lyase family enzyme
MAALPPALKGVVLAHSIVSDDVERSRRFYTEVLGSRGRVLRRAVRRADQSRTIKQLDRHQRRRWTDGRQPSVTLETPSDPHPISSFPNIRVKTSRPCTPARRRLDARSLAIRADALRNRLGS